MTALDSYSLRLNASIWRTMKSFLILLTVAVSCPAFFGCASGGEMPEDASLAKPPASLKGFAPTTKVEIIEARARFVENYEKLFDEDLIDDYGVIPIAIKLGLKGKDSEHETVYASPEDMDFRLYLEDGSALEAVSTAKIAGSDDDLEKRLNAHALSTDNLPKFDATGDKFVFFRLAPRKQFEFSSGRLTHQVGHISRVLAIDRSLMSFKITHAGKALPFYIGITRAQRGAE